MKITSWNVNGLRAVMKKDFSRSLAALQTDILCLQETKAQDEQVSAALEGIDGYHVYSNSAVRKGYSGVAILTRVAPLAVTADIGIEEHDQEGRVLTAEFDDFFLVTVYTPNSGNELVRLPYRQSWDAAFLAFVKTLEKQKPVLMCGDFNVAHREIDLARPKPNYNKSAGYTQQEIDGMDRIIDAGFIDTFRHLHPEEVKYSWWSYRAGARARNVGWRIDYVLGTASLVEQQVSGASIHNEILGSDHCPVAVTLDR
ncbi:exodeoxyribonuclease III [Seongchinamella sediminis]|uniref:Exodeoxyribonuclease III n=1 Tax=Seongchinamella sediminis TaxID=2283635 RepID=A0A3L7DXH6_9GAMM|nr:exodeoxyribonuclease III [Seongchinamella sediminis]RLQ20681.1 exodeoxyribonuclease III [Seongchinamella sediminis]